MILILILISTNSVFNLLTYYSHYLHFVIADPDRKSCFAGTFRTLDNVCKDCPTGTWSKDSATICCPDGQYEGLNALCENCPAGKYLMWSKCRSMEQNKCRTCQKGKVRENKSKSHYSDNLFLNTSKDFLSLLVTCSHQYEAHLSPSLCLFSTLSSSRCH